MADRKAILLGEHTYGYYYPDSNNFTCSHGGWSSSITLIDEHSCSVKGVPSIKTYKFICKIPEGWGQ